MTAVERYLETAYALIVAGAAMVYPPAALGVAALFLIALAVVADRRLAVVADRREVKLHRAPEGES